MSIGDQVLKPARSPAKTAPITPAAGPESAVCTGSRRTVSAPATPPVTTSSAAAAPGTFASRSRPSSRRDVGRDRGHDVDVEDRRHAALVLAEDRQHVRRERDQRAGQLGEQDLARAALVRRVGVAWRKQIATALMPSAAIARAAAARPPPRRAAGLTRPPASSRPATRGCARAARPIRLDPGEHVGLARNVVPADLEDVLEALGGEQRRLGALALEDQVGRDGGAVEHVAERRRREPRAPAPGRCRP